MPSSRTQQQMADLFQATGAQESCRAHTLARLTSTQQSGAREGYSSKHGNLTIKLPLKEAGIDKAGVLEILESSGLGLPSYYAWRSRSGCTFCFFQQNEWVHLMRQHPEAFEEAKRYEKTALDHGSLFTWSDRDP